MTTTTRFNCRFDQTAQLLREGTTYFQVVFTIPDKLSSLVLGNRRGGCRVE